ncbi:Macrolide export protein MacA [Rosistilla oblonga]|uniref:Macrolide export protein MacA n=1 Tax=Rosistilla oblonga TaxID=2527990 RepID=A0A518J266_9BACT|nr:HlyD family efflux transporter periplasmic adaptor subunit [Rosistilla oblonga]QDV12459.1 Macrolide export protein MacA [Rosistilla oblonga]QDV59428.1 Macrolide export protein MacA [Rosistilla oblonga]
MQMQNSKRQRRGSASTTIFAATLGMFLVCGVVGQFFGSMVDSVKGFFVEAPKPVYLTTTATMEPFVHTVLERGEVESSSNIEVRCEVNRRSGSAGTNIIEIVPEGTWVEAGDFLVRLDDSALQTQLIQQQIVCSNSESAVIEAQAKVDSTKLELSEYEEGTFKEKLAQQQSEVFVAQENKRRAEEYLDYSKRLAERGYIPEAQLEADTFAVEKARNELGVAETKLAVLNTFTKEKMLTQLRAEIRTAESRLQSRTKTWELDKVQLEEIEDQIEKCRIWAPVAGQVVYANNQTRSANKIMIEEGMPVRERQTIINLPDPKKMRVKTLVHESRIGHVRPGLTAELMLDAMPDLSLTGKVTTVSEYPLPAISVYMSHVKEYVVEVEITDPPRDLRPGMTAEVNILVQRIDQALQVPIEAVIEREGQYFCALPNEDGTLETREVVVGTTNETNLVIESGLSANEEVVLNVRTEQVMEQMDLPSLETS